MENLDITNIGTWIHDNDDVVYRYQVYKRLWTPHEMDKKYSDESEFTDWANMCKINNAILIPNDVLLELVPIFEDEEGEFRDGCYSEFYRLSELRLYKYKEDNYGEN